MKRPLARRQRRILLTATLVGLVAIACGTLAIIFKSDQPTSTSRTRRVEGITDRLARRLPKDHPKTKFVEAALEFGIKVKHGLGPRSSVLPEDMGPGCGLEDLDGDGDLDLVLVELSGPIGAGSPTTAKSPKTGPTHRLFRNDGGHFTDVTEGSGLDVRDFGLGVAIGDVDNDGLLDIYITCYGKNRLFRNLGDLRFEDVTDSAKVGDRGFGAGAVFADPDRDGDLDLYVCNYVDFLWDGGAPQASPQGDYSLPSTLNPSSYDPQVNRYYENTGKGVYVEKASDLGIDDPEGKSLSVTFADFNEDGWPDIYVLNDVSKNSYFENQKDGSFKDRSLTSRSADYRGAMGNAVADMDGDGDLDLFITHWLAQENGAYANLWRDRSSTKDLSKTGLTFGDVADFVGLGASALNFVGWGTAFFDYDFDGILDLVVVNGSTMPSKNDPRVLEAQRPQLFWQKRDSGFFEVGNAAGDCWSALWNARGLAEGDIDGDGDLDIVITTNFGPVHVLRNEGPTGHYLGVQLRQPKGNRFAVGARVEVTVAGRTMVREVGAGTSYLSHRPLRLSFGIGTHTRVDGMKIIWPDGSKSELASIQANQILTIVQTEGH